MALASSDNVHPHCNIFERKRSTDLDAPHSTTSKCLKKLHVDSRLVISPIHDSASTLDATCCSVGNGLNMAETRDGLNAHSLQGVNTQDDYIREL